MSDFDVDAAQQLCDRYKNESDPHPQWIAQPRLYAMADALPDALAEIRRLREQVQRVGALCSELNDEQARGGEYPVRELTVERIRAALGEPTTCLCNQPAPSCPVHRAAGYSQEDQDNLGQCGR